MFILETKNKIIAGICNLNNKKACQESDIQVEMIKQQILYKKTGDWFIEWQWMTTSSTTGDSEWQRVVQRVTTNDNEWQLAVTNDSEWQQLTMRDRKWQQVVQRMKAVQYTSKNGWLPSFLWQKQIHYFKGCMVPISVVK